MVFKSIKYMFCSVNLILIQCYIPSKINSLFSVENIKSLRNVDNNDSDLFCL